MNVVGTLFVVAIAALSLWFLLGPGSPGLDAADASSLKKEISTAIIPSEKPTPETWLKMIGPELVSQNDEVIPSSQLGGALLGLYFSASWCPPCRSFTPKLIDFYNNNNNSLRIVLMGLDRSEAQRESYYKKTKMPWSSVPFDSPIPDALAEELGVSGIPALVIINASGEIVSTDGVSEVLSNPSDALGEWER